MSDPAVPPGGGARYAVAFYLPWFAESLDVNGQVKTGGAEAQVLMLARALADRGHRVCIATWEPEHGLGSEVDGVDLVPFPRWKPRRGPVPGWSYLRYSRVVFGALRALNAGNYVQSAAGPEAFLIALAARRYRARFVYSAASLWDFDYRALARRRIDVELFKLGYRLSHRVVVQAHEQLELSRRRFGKEAIVIPSIAVPHRARSSPGKAFLWVGRAVDYKRPQAYVDLARAVPEARFWVVAVRGQDAGHLDELTRAAARTPNLELLPQRPRDQLQRLIARAVAVVSTSHAEGMPNVFLEAWALGVPTLALAHDPDGVIARFGLGGTAGGDPERLAGLASELWRGRADAGKIAHRCVEYVSRAHDTDRIVTDWERVLSLAPRRR